MRRKLKYIVLSLLVVTLAACKMSPPAEQLMTQVKPAQQLSIQSDKNLFLTWHSGKVIPAYIPVNAGGDGSIAGALIGAAMASYQQSANKNAYELKYGKAKQVVFMTSLRDNLTQPGSGFESVVLTATPPQPLPKQSVVVDVNFTETKVKNATGYLPIVLNVTLTAKDSAGKTLVQKNLKTEEDASFWENFKGRSFENAQIAASKDMMDKIITVLNDSLA